MFISGALRAFAGATVACRHAATTSSKTLAGSIGSGQGSHVELFLSGVLPSTSVQSGLNMGRPAVCFMLSRSFSSAAADGTLAPVLRNSDDDALLAHPPTTGTSPLTVRYPFTIDYYKNREAVVFNLDEQPTGIVRLPGAAFNVPVRLDILHRVVRYWRAKWQQGTHKAKNRAEARGGGRKPWPQKKTSRARQGSIRSPLWKGGGTTHGPRPRSHAHSLPRSLLLLGMRCALSAKINEGRFFVVDDFLTIRNADTTYSLKDYRELKERLTRLTAGSYGAKWLLLDNGGVGAEALRLRKMLKQSVLMEVVVPEQLTVYHLLKYDRMVVTRAALEEMADTLTQPHRIKKPVVHAWWAKRREAVEAAERELLEAMRQD